MSVQEERGPRAKIVVSRRYRAFDERAVAGVARSRSAGIRDVTSLVVGRSKESRGELSYGNPKIFQFQMIESSVFCGRFHSR